MCGVFWELFHPPACAWGGGSFLLLLPRGKALSLYFCRAAGPEGASVMVSSRCHAGDHVTVNLGFSDSHSGAGGMSTTYSGIL